MLYMMSSQKDYLVILLLQKIHGMQAFMLMVAQQIQDKYLLIYQRKPYHQTKLIQKHLQI